MNRNGEPLRRIRPKGAALLRAAVPSCTLSAMPTEQIYAGRIFAAHGNASRRLNITDAPGSAPVLLDDPNWDDLYEQLI
jgi:hypothetical protein